MEKIQAAAPCVCSSPSFLVVAPRGFRVCSYWYSNLKSLILAERFLALGNHPGLKAGGLWELSESKRRNIKLLLTPT